MQRPVPRPVVLMTVSTSVPASTGIAMMADDADSLFELIRDAIGCGELTGIVLSKPKRIAEGSVRRIDIRGVVIRGEDLFQWSQQRGTQVFHENRDGAETLDRLMAVAGQQFRHVQVKTNAAIWSGRYSKRGVCRLMQEKATPPQETASAAHNRVRPYLIPEGVPVTFLVEKGIMTSAG